MELNNTKFKNLQTKYLKLAQQKKKNDEITEKITSKKIKTEINKKEKKDIERAKIK